MKFSTTVIFSVLFAVVAGFYTYLSPNPESVKAVSPSSASARLVALEGDNEINWIQIQNLERKEPITLALEGDRWILRYPVSYPTDPLIVNGLVTALTLSTVGRRLFPEEGWDEYGLLNPSIKVGIQTKRGGKRQYLYLGSQSPVGEYIYAKWEGGMDYFLLDKNFKQAFDRSLYSVRQKQIFRTPVGDISRIDVKTASRELELARENGQWMWVKPSQAASGLSVSKERMDEFLILLRDLFVKDFLDAEKKDRREYGITDDGTSIKVWGTTVAPEVFYLGREAPAKNGFFGTRAGENVIFLVSRDNIRLLFEMLETAADEAVAMAAKQSSQMAAKSSTQKTG